MATPYKILVFTDMHGSKRAVEQAKKLLTQRKFDMVAYLGDFSARPADEAANMADSGFMIKEFSGLAEFKSLMGNCDTKALLASLEKQGVSLHNKVLMKGDTALIGWGGSHPTPFKTPSEFEEQHIEASIEKLFKEAEGKGAKRMVLLTHEPPARTLADKLPFGHVGSEALRRVIERHQPEVNLCGHIHEAKSSDSIGKTKIINIGPSSSGHFVALGIGDKIDVELINL